MLFCAVVAAAGLLNTADAYTCVNAMVNALTQGLVLFGVTRLNDLRTQLHAARHELAEASVAEERERASRDLESVLGSSLSAIITLAAQGRTGDILTLARRAAARARQAPPRPGAAVFRRPHAPDWRSPSWWPRTWVS
ncbi:hypothetical protein [Nonomuraea dietziae]|uniref:hypothetical protein n=1 Tax=Nonomuraea dietziae TaxID=65515 RepID=UPI0031E44006